MVAETSASRSIRIRLISLNSVFVFRREFAFKNDPFKVKKQYYVMIITTVSTFEGTVINCLYLVFLHCYGYYRITSSIGRHIRVFWEINVCLFIFDVIIWWAQNCDSCTAFRWIRLRNVTVFLGKYTYTPI